MVAPLLGRIREALGDLETTPVPTVVRHRDYTPWNVIRSPGGLRVLDWEGAGPGAPVEDLIHFLTHWHEIATNAFTGEDRGRAIVALFCDPSATEGGLVTHARMLVREYALQLGIDARWIPIFIAQGPNR
jgi:thiamine kinase-like enzyme